MKKKNVVLAAVAAAVVTMVAGCGNQAANNTSQGDGSQTTGKVTGSFTMAGSTSMEKMARATNEVFMNTYPGTNVTAEFIGSGAAAQAIIYYVTDYLTKQMISSFGAYSTIQTAINRIRTSNVFEDDIVSSLRKLIIKCANALVSKQELSAQQVASYVMGHRDHFTTSVFKTLYWKTFERYIEEEENCMLSCNKIFDCEEQTYGEPMYAAMVQIRSPL